MSLPGLTPEDVPTTRWFSAQGCVVREGEVGRVFVGGQLLGSFTPQQSGPRNVLLCMLSQDRKVHQGRLAQAFEVTTETVRLLRQSYQQDGLEAVWRRRHGGSQPKLTGPKVSRIEALFEQGVGVAEVLRRVGRRYGVSQRTVERLRTAWRARTEREGFAPTAKSAPEEAPGPVQLSLGEAAGSETAPPREAPVATDEEPLAQEPATAQKPESLAGGERIDVAEVQSARSVQHAGTWLLVAMVHALGLYQEAWRVAGKAVERGPLRIALDALVMALALGQRCVEGVRRLSTPSAPRLLRAQRMPSASWVRWKLGQFSQRLGGVALHLGMAQAYVQRAAAEAQLQDEPVVFYVDNHLRPYTGKHTVRKGWRMQDKRVVPGCSDYYVHDEDGRPVLRLSVPEHTPLTDWLLPIARLLREALGPGPRLLLCFDRAGAHPEQMAGLRQEGVEFVTYERRPYPRLLPGAFDESVGLRDETVRLGEPARKNLRKGRGRVRRISVLYPDGRQVNLLALSEQPALWLLHVMVGRWRQENGFKHAGQRWGQNQLDGRAVEPYPDTAVIPNPARRRLDHALRIARTREGHARSTLARLGEQDPRREAVQCELTEALEQQEQLEALRPSVPTHAPIAETELRDVLVRHREEYKVALDTVRIACANAESEMAVLLAPLLPRATEAKKALGNLLAAPGRVHAASDSITVTLQPAGSATEQDAFEQFLLELDARCLTLPGDPRPLRFRLPT